jgi:PAS domain S-box-containing protein
METQADALIQVLRLAAIVEGSDDAIVSKDVNGIVITWNGAAERMFGYSAADMIGQSIRRIIPPERQSEEDDVLSRIRRGDRVEHFETVRRHRDGSPVEVSITISPIRTPDGRVIGASKIARDISERKRTERALAEARVEQTELRRRLSTIINASGALLLSPSLDDVFAAILDLARQVLPSDASAVWRLHDDAWRVVAAHGLSDPFLATAVASTPMRERLVDDLLVMESVADPRLAYRTDAYVAEGIAALLVVPLHVGSEMVASVAFYYRAVHPFSLVERESAVGLGRLASAVIATAHLYDEQRRQRREADFLAEAGAALAEMSSYQDGLWHLAQQAAATLADWCAFHVQIDEGPLQSVALAGIQADEALIDTFLRPRPEEKPEVFSVERVVRTTTPTLIEEWTGDVCRECHPVRLEAADALGVGSVICVPLLAHGRTLGALTLGLRKDRRAFDTTQMRFAQELAHRTALSLDNLLSYEQARTANRLKDEFLANLSHELRTPLNAVLGYVQMLRKGALPETRRERAYEVLEKNASALTQIVEDVLDISRIVSGKIRLQLRPVEVAPIVHHSVETVQPGADAKGVRIEVTHADAVTVAGDADRLQQVFWNLLSNAAKFTPRDGRIVVRVVRRGANCEVEVSDDGIGIDPRVLPHVFERFRQGDSRVGREHSGLGLGLAIARQIVEMHGGSIVAESAGVGQGATFRVTVPLLAE